MAFRYIDHPKVLHLSPTKLRESGTNYQNWKIQMVYQIHSQGLLGFINGSEVPPHETINSPADSTTTVNNPAYHIWRNTDMLLKQGILSQLEIAPIEIMASITSKDIWLKLEEKFNDPSPSIADNLAGPSTSIADTTTNAAEAQNQLNIVRVLNQNECSSLYTAALEGDWDKTAQVFQDIIVKTRSSARINTIQATALHVAVGSGKKAVRFVDSLVRQMTHESILSKDEIGDTALSIAATVGNKDAAVILVKERPNLLYIPNSLGIFPVHAAAKFARKEVLEYLIQETQNDPKQNLYAGTSGLTLLIYVIEAGFYGIALELVTKFSDLARLKVSTDSALKTIAVKKSGTFYQGLQVITLVKQLCEEMKSLNIDEAENIYRDAILLAAQSDNHKIVKEIVTAFPSAIYCSDPATFKTIFHVVVENRSENTYNLIFKMSDKRIQLYLNLPDIDGNNLLHLAAKFSPSNKLDEQLRETYQMRTEVLWYQRVRKLVSDFGLESQLNHAGKTPSMMFYDEHENLRQRAEKLLKDTNNSYIIVAILVFSVTFAASITVPGGNDAKTGMPVFSGKLPYIFFLMSNFLSIVISLCSLVSFLNTSTVAYSSEKSYLHQPLIQSIGVMFLVASTFSMFLSFLCSFFLLVGITGTIVSCILTLYVVVLYTLMAYRGNKFRTSRFLGKNSSVHGRSLLSLC